MLPLKRRLKPKVAPEEAMRTLFTKAQSGQKIKANVKNSQHIYALIMRQILVTEKRTFRHIQKQCSLY